MIGTRVNTAFSNVFQSLVRSRNGLYDSHVLPVTAVAGVRVISVGNIAAGGSGKTPLAIYLAKQLQEKGLSTTLILRGYGGRKSGKGLLVSTGAGPLCGAIDAGDEAVMAAAQLFGVTVRIGADRVSQCRIAAASGAQVIVLDDGFQHRRIARDCDIVLIRPEDMARGAQFIPAGHLRDSQSQLRRAHLLAGLECDWHGHPSAPPLLLSQHPEILVDATGTHLPIGALAGTPAFLLSGIARSHRFKQTALSVGISVVGEVAFPDHHVFSRRELKRVALDAGARGAQVIVTTEKDRARLSRGGVELLSFPVYAIRIIATPFLGKDALDAVLKPIVAAAVK